MRWEGMTGVIQLSHVFFHFCPFDVTFCHLTCHLGSGSVMTVQKAYFAPIFAISHHFLARRPLHVKYLKQTWNTNIKPWEVIGNTTKLHVNRVIKCDMFLSYQTPLHLNPCVIPHIYPTSYFFTLNSFYMLHCIVLSFLCINMTISYGHAFQGLFIWSLSLRSSVGQALGQVFGKTFDSFWPYGFSYAPCH